jgi:hypothetical protein
MLRIHHSLKYYIVLSIPWISDMPFWKCLSFTPVSLRLPILEIEYMHHYLLPHSSHNAEQTQATGYIQTIVKILPQPLLTLAFCYLKIAPVFPCSLKSRIGERGSSNNYLPGSLTSVWRKLLLH